MIEITAVRSTIPSGLSRRAVLALGATTALSACVGIPTDPRPGASQPLPRQDGEFVMPDGERLPFRSWLPNGEPDVVVLALHGFNDSRDAWEVPAPVLTEAGFAVYGPDQRGFGATPERGFWVGGDRMVADASQMAHAVARMHPRARLVLMGESMGGAILMCLATSSLAPPGARYVMVAPAVWGRATMSMAMRSGLWAVSTLMPDLAVLGAPIHVTASDNRDAIIRLSRDQLTIRSTRFGTARGLVDLMDAALASAASFTTDGLFLYGGEDELVPKPATARMWRSLPSGGARTAFYPHDYHLMLRDKNRMAPLKDIIGWVRDPLAPLPSGADLRAAKWLASENLIAASLERD